MYGGCFNFFRNGMWGGGFMMFLGIIVLGVILYWLFSKQNIRKETTPIDLLSTKYINGEITKEEYEEKLTVLKKNK